jgi:hypothetical protein
LGAALAAGEALETDKVLAADRAGEVCAIAGAAVNAL